MVLNAVIYTIQSRLSSKLNLLKIDRIQLFFIHLSIFYFVSEDRRREPAIAFKNLITRIKTKMRWCMHCWLNGNLLSLFQSISIGIFLLIPKFMPHSSSLSAHKLWIKCNNAHRLFIHISSFVQSSIRIRCKHSSNQRLRFQRSNPFLQWIKF